MPVISSLVARRGKKCGGGGGWIVVLFYPHERHSKCLGWRKTFQGFLSCLALFIRNSVGRCYARTQMCVFVLAPGGFCSTMRCLIPTWATARACPTWWPPCSLRSKTRATRFGASSASWRTPSSSAPRVTKTWRGSW